MSDVTDPSDPPPHRRDVKSLPAADALPDGNGRQPGEPAADEDRPADKAEPKPRRQKRSIGRTLLEWVTVIGGALLIALIVKAFLVQAFWIPSASMVPTLHEGDRVLVNKLSYDLHDVNRGDLIVFERPEGEGLGGGNGEREIKDLIKRVIGLPGDTLEARDGAVFLNGDRLDEPYLASGTFTGDLPTLTVPEGHVFVMGDNRTDSWDSRYFGPIDEHLIIGRAFVRIYPLDDISWL